MEDEHPVLDSEIKFGLERHILKDVEPPRPLNDWELAVFDRLLSVPFKGRDNVRRQVPVARVQAECTHCPYMWFDTSVSVPAEAMIPQSLGILGCELAGTDVDGVPFEIFIHVRNGRLYIFDVFRVDSESFLTLPNPTSMEIICGR